MNKLTYIICTRCNCDNYFDATIYHKDPINGEVNPFIRHCTFCTRVLE